jgi:two-component system sensor histidine kinase QseC
MSWRELRNSLRGRLLLHLSAALAFCLGAFVAGFDLLIDHEIDLRLEHNMAAHLQDVGGWFAAHPGASSLPEEPAPGPGPWSRLHRDLYQIWDAAGRTVAKSFEGPGFPLPELHGSAAHYWEFCLPNGEPGRGVVLRMPLPAGDPRGALVMMLAEDNSEMQVLEGRLHVLLALGMLLTLVFILVLAWQTLDHGLRPVRALDETLANAGDIDPARAPPRFEVGHQPQELRPVLAKFAGLVERLYRALASEQRFARNLAHELRTPLAELRMTADVGVLDGTVEALRAHLHSIGRTTEELEGIVRTLLLLARYGAALEEPDREPVDFAALLATQLGRRAGRLEVRGLHVGGTRPAEYWIEGEAILCERLISNLLENAVEYAPPGSTIEIGLDERGLVVRNPAPDLVPARVAELGERFGRVATAPGENTPLHLGVGLALVAAIVRVHAWSVSHRLDEHGCLVTTVGGLAPVAVVP